MNMIVWSKAQELSDAGAVNEAQVQIAMLAYAMQYDMRVTSSNVLTAATAASFRFI